jgi:hypothetical protein
LRNKWGNESEIISPSEILKFWREKIRRLKYLFVSKLFAESGMGIWRGWDLKI